MKIINLKKIDHKIKLGMKCELIEPNITEDTIFMEDGEVIGFFIQDISKHSETLSKLVGVANNELMSERVPKLTMKRSSGQMGRGDDVLQYSTIIGSVPPKYNMHRPYRNISSVHAVKSAQTFIKSMILVALESEKLIQKYAPELYRKQLEVFKNVDDKWKLGNIFTSSISNYNISASYHTDNANLKNCVNVIICKRKNSKGGCTTIPDYGTTVNSADNSMLVYPAWRNLHGVTPIIPLAPDGYRNTLVFYPLKAFLNK